MFLLLFMFYVKKLNCLVAKMHSHESACECKEENLLKQVCVAFVSYSMYFSSSSLKYHNTTLQDTCFFPSVSSGSSIFILRVPVAVYTTNVHSKLFLVCLSSLPCIFYNLSKIIFLLKSLKKPIRQPKTRRHTITVSGTLKTSTYCSIK